MRIELQKALLPDDLKETKCGLCGQRFRPLGAVLAWVQGADRQPLGYACPSCTLHFGRRNPDRFPSTEEYLAATRKTQSLSSRALRSGRGRRTTAPSRPSTSAAG